MNRNLYILLLLSSNICFSQFAIIADSDGFANVRSSADNGDNLFDTLENGFVVYCFEYEGNWINIDYKKNGKELNGYVYKNRIKLISDFTNIPLLSNKNGLAKLANDNVQIEISESKFIKENHKLEFYRNEKSQLEKVDNLRMFGTDGNIPKMEYKSVNLNIDGTKIELPQIALKNLFEPNLSNSTANYDRDNDILYLASMNSDGAGGYLVLWIVENKKYTKRFETYGF